MTDLTKTSLLHRLRILFDDSGVPTLVETVHKVAIKEGGTIIGHVEELVKTVSPHRLHDAINAFMASLEAAKIADKAEEEAVVAVAAAAAAAAATPAPAAATPPTTPPPATPGT